MAYKIKKKYITIFIILISAALLLAASYFIEISKIPPKTEASLKENQNILPVLYYEQNSGFGESEHIPIFWTGKKLRNLKNTAALFQGPAPLPPMKG